jgi:hypothetical protein
VSVGDKPRIADDFEAIVAAQGAIKTHLGMMDLIRTQIERLSEYDPTIAPDNRLSFGLERLARLRPLYRQLRSLISSRERGDEGPNQC